MFLNIVAGNSPILILLYYSESDEYGEIFHCNLPDGMSDETLPENWVKCYDFTNRQAYVDGLLARRPFPVWRGIPPQDCLDDLNLLFQSCGEYFFDSCIEAKPAV